MHLSSNIYWNQLANPKYNFLFIDDSLSTHKYLSFLIKIKNLAIVPKFFKSPIKALSLLDQMDINDFPDVIVTDIDMPIMEGFQFVETFVEKYNHLHPSSLIYVTSALFNGDRIAKVKNNAHIVDFIPKPINAQAFNEKIFPLLKIA